VEKQGHPFGSKISTAVLNASKIESLRSMTLFASISVRSVITGRNILGGKYMIRAIVFYQGGILELNRPERGLEMHSFYFRVLPRIR
jgi:hypothetical protein